MLFRSKLHCRLEPCFPLPADYLCFLTIRHGTNPAFYIFIPFTTIPTALSRPGQERTFQILPGRWMMPTKRSATGASINIISFISSFYKPGHHAVPSSKITWPQDIRSEEHTSELQSHSFISYAFFCLKKKNFFFLVTLLHLITQH